ncbi:ribosome biogenesis protein [archaeon]|nr:ribosome biogenesis protein [archaeon]
MKSQILKCFTCNSYTLNPICNNCKSKTKSTKPAKWSPQDKYGSFRRIYKKKFLKN